MCSSRSWSMADVASSSVSAAQIAVNLLFGAVRIVESYVKHYRAQSRVNYINADLVQQGLENLIVISLHTYSSSNASYTIMLRFANAHASHPTYQQNFQ